jgi:hypothetical protein
MIKLLCFRTRQTINSSLELVFYFCNSSSSSAAELELLLIMKLNRNKQQTTEAIEFLII